MSSLPLLSLRSTTRMLALTLAVASSFCSFAEPAQASDDGVPFSVAANAALIPTLSRGRVIQRSSLDHTLTQDDSVRLQSLGLPQMHASVVVLHFVPKKNVEHQMARLRSLAHAIDGFAPSGACDKISTEGDGRGVCFGTVDGPLGTIPARMPVAIKLEQPRADGTFELAVRNTRPLEVKPLLSWSKIVETNNLKVAMSFYPQENGWLVYTRMAVGMSAHTSSAKTVTDALLKLDAWLCRDLAQ